MLHTLDYDCKLKQILMFSTRLLGVGLTHSLTLTSTYLDFKSLVYSSLYNLTFILYIYLQYLYTTVFHRIYRSGV